MLNFNNVRLRPDLFSGVRLNIEALIRAAELKRGHEFGRYVLQNARYRFFGSPSAIGGDGV